MNIWEYFAHLRKRFMKNLHGVGRKFATKYMIMLDFIC